MNHLTLPKALDTAKVHTEVAVFDFATTETSKTVVLNLPSVPFHATAIIATGIDSVGKVIELQTTRDKFSFEMRNKNKKIYQSDPQDLFSMNKLIDNLNYKGITFARDEDVTLKVTKADLPAAEIMTFPIRIEIALCGYKLDETYNAIIE